MSVKPNVEYKSQIGQDKWVVEEVFKGMTNGFFVDIGAGDGVCISNTYVLEKEYQWDGICVEANLATFEMLKSNRKCAVDNSFVLDDRAEIEFREYNGNFPHWEYFSSMYPCPSREKMAGDKTVVRKVKPITLGQLLQRHNPSNVIHYMSIDVEGAEFEILNHFFTKEQGTGVINPTRAIICLTVEHNSKPERELMYNLLTNLPINRFVKIKGGNQEDWYINYDFLNLLKL